MKKHIGILTVLLSTLTTMPFEVMALRGSDDCPLTIQSTAFRVWAGDTMESGFKHFYSSEEKQVYNDKASLQKFRKKYSDALQNESLLSDWKYTKPLSCNDAEKGCFFQCNGDSTTYKNGQKLKDCNIDVYKCMLDKKIRKEYQDFMINKICGTSTSSTSAQETDSKNVSTTANEHDCSSNTVWVEELKLCQAPETAKKNKEFNKKYQQCIAAGASGYADDKGCLCHDEKNQKWNGTKCVSIKQETQKANNQTTTTDSQNQESRTSSNTNTTSSPAEAEDSRTAIIAAAQNNGVTDTKLNTAPNTTYNTPENLKNNSDTTPASDKSTPASNASAGATSKAKNSAQVEKDIEKLTTAYDKKIEELVKKCYENGDTINTTTRECE